MPGRQDDKGSLICLAASYNDDKAVAVLFAYGSNLNETHQHEHGLSKHTALETCAIFGHVSVVSFLLDNGGNVIACSRVRMFICVCMCAGLEPVGKVGEASVCALIGGAKMQVCK